MEQPTIQELAKIIRAANEGSEVPKRTWNDPYGIPEKTQLGDGTIIYPTHSRVGESFEQQDDDLRLAVNVVTIKWDGASDVEAARSLRRHAKETGAGILEGYSGNEDSGWEGWQSSSSPAGQSSRFLSPGGRRSGSSGQATGEQDFR